MELFGKPKRKKNGEDSKVKVLPPLGDVQQSADADTRRRLADVGAGGGRWEGGEGGIGEDKSTSPFRRFCPNLAT